MTHDLSTRDGFDRELARRIKLRPDTDPVRLYDVLMSEAKVAILEARLAALSPAVRKPRAN